MKSEPIPLTETQEKILQFMKDFIRKHRYPPTIRQIGERFGHKSPNGTMCHLVAMEKKGFVTHSPKSSRGWMPADEQTHESEAILLLREIVTHPPWSDTFVKVRDRVLTFLSSSDKEKSCQTITPSTNLPLNGARESANTSASATSSRESSTVDSSTPSTD